MEQLHIQWLTLLRVDIYHERSNLLKITQIALKELEDFQEPTRYTSKRMQSQYSSSAKIANHNVIKAENKAQSDGKGWHNS